MALNQNKIQSLHDNINSLDVQKGMKDTVTKIEGDIFELFSHTEINVSDKKNVSTLESALFSRITSLETAKPTKNNKEIIEKLSVQKNLLTDIRNSIDQVDDPKVIEKGILAQDQKNIQLLQSNIITDYKDISVRVSNLGSCIMGGKKSKIKIVSVNENNTTQRQLEYQDKIFCRIQKGGEGRVMVPNPNMQALGITNVSIPFIVQKDIYIPDPQSGRKFVSIVTKEKKWNIDTLQRLNSATPSTTPTVTPSTTPTVTPSTTPTVTPSTTPTVTPSTTPTVTPSTTPTVTPSTTPTVTPSTEPKTLELPPHTPEDPVDTIDQKMEQLFKLVNIADMRMQYNNLKVRWDTLKMHMQNFNRNQDINADTPLFKSIFPALEHEVNEFKKQLTNAILDTQDKIDKVKNSGIADLAKVKQLEQELADIKAKYKAIADEFDTVHKELFARIYKKTPKQLPPHTRTQTPPIDEPPVDEPPTNNPSTSEKIDISAHIMDKESLVKKSIEQDVLEEYQHKYAKRRWPKRLAMYTFARWRQDNRINNRLGLSKKYNEAIETDITRQQRVASSIGNFASEYDMGVDAGKVKKTALASNDKVNSIANNYIKGSVSRQEAISQFNEFFSSNKDYQTGMTGSDIMEQLDDVAFMVAINQYVKKNGQRTPDDYRNIQEKISEFFGTHPTAQLHGVHFSNPNVASKAEIDTLCDHILAYKSKTAVTQLNNITANVKLYKVEKDTVDLTQSKLREHNRTRVDKVFTVANAATFGMAGSTVGNMLLKTGAGVGLAATGVGALGVVGGVAGLAAVLQWMKTYRDYLTEAQKTHEDAMTMGTKELDRRIKEVEDQIKKHTTMQKTLAFWGFGKHAIRTKQLNILKAVNDQMHKTGAMKPAIQLITEMQHVNRDKQALAIAETLARLKAGRELNTNFISGSTRALTEQERKSLLIQLRDSAAQRATKVGYGHLVPPRNATEEKWRMFWDRLIAVPQNNIGPIYQRKYAELKKNFQGMKDDINKGRKKMARRDAGTNLATSVTVAGVAAGVSAGVQALNGGSSGAADSTIQGPHNEYALGQYETPITNKASGWENALNNGDKVSFQGEAAVDAVNASRGTFGDISKEVSEVTKLAGSFDSTTQAAVNNALTTELAKVKAEAIKAGADAGNVALTQQRWVDGVEEMLTKLQSAGKTGVTIENIKFDPSTFNPIDIQASAAAGSGVGMQDVIDRSVAFQATVNGVPGTWGGIEPLWVVWPGFSNTYAKPGDESKHDDSWSKRTKDLAKKDKEEQKKEQENDDYNKDFERKYGNGEPYVPTPPVQDKKKHREDKWQDNEGKPFEEPSDTPQDHPYGEKEDKRGVSPRGREGSRRDSDVPRYFEKDYPQTPSILSAEQAAEKIIAAKVRGRPLGEMPFVADTRYEMGQYAPQIEDAIQAKNYKLAVDLLTKSIQSEELYIQEQIQELGYDRTIKSSLRAVDTVFDELGVSTSDRAEVPDADHVHIIPGYLFYAQYNKYDKDTLGFVYHMNGHIFINNEALEHGPNGDRSATEKKEVLLHIITHEVVHGASTSNYHKRWKEINGKLQDGTEEYAFSRRLGAQMTRRINKNGQIYLEERGRALNEGLTESLNHYILQEKLGINSEPPLNAYQAEREIVDMVGTTFAIKKQDLYKFLINRKFGKEVIKKIYGEPTARTDATGTMYASYQRPGYITLLMELMDMEHLQRSDKSLPLAKNFVKKEPLTIKKEQSKNFHPSLINKDGSLREEILQAYPFIRQA